MDGYLLALIRLVGPEYVRRLRKPDWSPLLRAAACNRISTAKLLFEHVPWIWRSSQGIYALSPAVKRGHTQMVRLVIEEGVRAVHDRKAGSNTPTFKGEPGLTGDEHEHALDVALLALFGKDLARQLVHKAASGHIRKVKGLLQSWDGRRASDARGVLGLLAHCVEFPTLHPGKSEHERSSVFAFPFDLSPSNPLVRCMDRLGEASLHDAVQAGRVETVRGLLEMVVDVNIITRGWPLIVVAARARQPEVMEVLVEYGADFEWRWQDKAFTPLFECLSPGSVDKVMENLTVLLNRGADIKARVWNEQTILHVAAARSATYCSGGSWKSIVPFLCHHGAMIDAVDDKGQTPLHIAARVRNIPFMNALFECGCDPDISDKDGKTARQYLPGFNAAADVPIIAGQKLRGDIT